MIYILLTEKCNAKCEYCYFPKIKPYIIDTYNNLDELKKIFMFLHKIDNDILLGGGEPGIIPVHQLDDIFNILNKCMVATNGTFVKNGLYERYKEKISIIDYHVLHPDCKIYETPVNKYIYIVHRKNIKTIPHLLKRFGNTITLKFYNSIRRNNITEDDLILTNDNLNELLTYCIKFNYNESFTEVIKNHINVKDRMILNNKCRYLILPTPGLNLVKNKISPCCRSDYLVDDTYPDITYENFKKYVYRCNPLKGYGKELLDKIPCESCYRFFDDDIFDNKVIKTYIRQRVKALTIIKNEI